MHFYKIKNMKKRKIRKKKLKKSVNFCLTLMKF